MWPRAKNGCLGRTGHYPSRPRVALLPLTLVGTHCSRPVGRALDDFAAAVRVSLTVGLSSSLESLHQIRLPLIGELRGPGRGNPIPRFVSGVASRRGRCAHPAHHQARPSVQAIRVDDKATEAAADELPKKRIGPALASPGFALD
jgi:hypothetical protein